MSFVVTVFTFSIRNAKPQLAVLNRSFLDVTTSLLLAFQPKMYQFFIHYL